MLTLRNLGTALMIWGTLVLVAVLVLGVLPRTWVGALLLVLFGPVVWLVVEAIAGLALGGLTRLQPVAGLNEWVQEKTAAKKISPLRIGIVLIEVGLLLGFFAVVVFWLNDTIIEDWWRAVTPFFKTHFR